MVPVVGRERPLLLRYAGSVLEFEDILWPAATGAPWQATHWLLLAAYSFGFGALAAWGFARDELQDYR